jgi:hypothetical protein
MRISSVSRERISIQQELGSSCVPIELRQLITCFTRLASPLMLPPTRDVSAAFQRRLEHRAQHRTVDHDRGSMTLRLSQLVGDSCTGGEINQTVGRIGGRLYQDQPTLPFARAACAVFRISTILMPSAKPKAVTPNDPICFWRSVSVPP